MQQKIKTFNYKQQWGVILICYDEADQNRIYNDLLVYFPDHKIKVVTV